MLFKKENQGEMQKEPQRLAEGEWKQKRRPPRSSVLQRASGPPRSRAALVGMGPEYLGHTRLQGSLYLTALLNKALHIWPTF